MGLEIEYIIRRGSTVTGTHVAGYNTLDDALREVARLQQMSRNPKRDYVITEVRRTWSENLLVRKPAPLKTKQVKLSVVIPATIEMTVIDDGGKDDDGNNWRVGPFIDTRFESVDKVTVHNEGSDLAFIQGIARIEGAGDLPNDDPLTEAARLVALYGTHPEWVFDTED